MVTYRHYKSGDEVNIVALWNDCLLRDPITPRRFRNLVLLDANFDPKGLKLAFYEKKLIGCVYAIRRLMPMYGTDLEPDNGWVPFFFVDGRYRNLGVGKQLMKEAEVFFKENRRKRMFFSSYAPNYILPGIDEAVYPDGYKFLLNQGFVKQYSPVAMDKNLVDYQIPKQIIKLTKERETEGHIFRKAEDRDLYDVVKFANRKFNPDWGRAIREGILQGLPLERILIASIDSKITGFCIYGGYEGIPDRFGPFGVDESQQGKGLGKILLHQCLQSMKAEGLHGAWFLWTGEKSSAGYLYKKAGFEVSRRFHVMKKEI